MRTYWGIHGGESVELYDGGESKGKSVVYRVCVERVVRGEVKIIRGTGKQKIINSESRLKAVDLVVGDSLFLEFVGANGFAYGWYECVGSM